MIFSARHYLALSRVYSDTFHPVPEAVALAAALAAAENGRATQLMDALVQTIEAKQEIEDWKPYATA